MKLSLHVYLFVFISFFIPSLLLSQNISQDLNVANSFIENVGQWDKSVDYVFKSKGLNLYISKDKVYFDMFEKDTLNTKGHIISLEMVNSSKQLSFKSNDSLNTKYNFFYASKSFKNVKSYKQLTAHSIYKGIDLQLNIINNSPRYDFIVAPNADPQQIQFTINGSDNVDIVDNEIIIATKTGTLKHGKIFAYQNQNGVNRQIECKLALNKKNITFDLGEYDSNLPLIIDPYIYGTFIGGSNFDEIKKCQVDSKNNLVFAGNSLSNPIRTKEGEYTTKLSGQKDFFIGKLSFSHFHRSIDFITMIGGSKDDELSSLALDKHDDIYVCGTTESSDLPRKLTKVTDYGGQKDMFLMQISSDSKELIFSTYVGGQDDDIATDIAVGESLAIYLIGASKSSDLPMNSAFDKSFNGNFDAVIFNFDPHISSIKFSTYLGGSKDDVPTCISLNEKLNMFAIAGYTSSETFPIYPRWGWNSKTFDKKFNGMKDGFIAQYIPGSSNLQFSSFFGGNDDDEITDIEIKQDLTMVFAGKTKSKNGRVAPHVDSTNFPLSANAYQSKLRGNSDGFIAIAQEKLARLEYSSYFGGNKDDMIHSLEIDPNIFDIIVVGETNSTNLPINNDHTFNTLSGKKDGFFTKFDRIASDLKYSTYVGGNKEDIITDLSIDKNNGIFLAGNTNSTEFTTIEGANSGNQDGFILKYSPYSLSLVHPKTDEAFCKNGSISIEWVFNDFESNYITDITYSSDNGVKWDTIALKVEGSKYVWKLPKNISQGDKYKIRVSHISGVFTETDKTFIIKDTPTILSEKMVPNKTKFCTGETATLSVEAIGFNLNYLWQKDGNNISGSNQDTLTFDKLTSENNGTYKVMVTNSCSPDLYSKEFQIFVSDTVKITSTPMAKTVIENSKLVLSVAVNASDAAYQWVKNGVYLQDQIQKDLTINATKLSDAGKYHCVVSSYCNVDSTGAYDVTVEPDSHISDLHNDIINGIVISDFRVYSDRISASIETVNRLNYSITIVDINGQKLFDSRQASTNFEFNIENLSSGIYFLTAQQKNSKATIKFNIIK